MFNYVNFGLKTCYSILESIIKIDNLISFALKNHIKVLTIADTNNLYAAPAFYNACLKAKIKPIIGMEIRTKENSFFSYAKNWQGYLDLVKISSDLNSEITQYDFQKYDWSNLLIISSEPLKNIANIVLENEIFFQKTFFLKKEQMRISHLLAFIKNTQTEKSKSLLPFYQLNPSVPAAKLQKTFELASECNLKWENKYFQFPKYKNSNQIKSKTWLQKICYENLQKLTETKKLDYCLYQKRLDYEINVITKMKFEDYFLIIYDFVNWARQKKIIIGPGRGSAPASLVCFLLNITSINPVKYQLLFERFLNFERVTLPDIDLDIEDERRHEVLEYLFDKYPLDTVAQIITFQRFGPKLALRDALRFQGMNLSEIDLITQKIPHQATSLKEIKKEITFFRAELQINIKLQEAFNLAMEIEGIPRQIGTHAAGVVISNQTLSQLVPTLEIEGKLHTQYTMNYLEQNGLVKIDILGLRNLTVIRQIQDLIFQKRQKRVNLDQIPLELDSVKKLFTSGSTLGIFQFESYGMRRTLQEVKVNCFADLIAIIALFRPGPMENIKVYAQRKNQQISKNFFASKILNELLKETYWIIVYQEQIMLIAQKFAGLSFAKADLMRRAISKKNESQFAVLKAEFFAGAKLLNRNPAETSEVFQLIEKFANYGFNKAHATAYSLISYWMAYFKTVLPIYFYAAVLDNEFHSIVNLTNYWNEARLQKINFNYLSINQSEENFCIENNSIFFPFKVVQGINNIDTQKIVKERFRNGKYLSFFQAVARLNYVDVDKNSFIQLIKAGAFDEFANRTTIMNNLNSALRYSEMILIKDENSKKIHFDLLPEPVLKKFEIDFQQISEWEKLVLGNNFQFHPILNQNFNNRQTILSLLEKRELAVLGYLEKIFLITTKNNKKMAKIIISDETASIEVTVFASLYERISKKLHEKKILFFNINNINKNNLILINCKDINYE